MCMWLLLLLWSETEINCLSLPLLMAYTNILKHLSQYTMYCGEHVTYLY